MTTFWQRPRRRLGHSLKMILRNVDFKNGRCIGSCPTVLAVPNFDVQSQLRYEFVGTVSAGSESCQVATLCVHHYVNLQLLENKGMSSPDNLEQICQGLILFIWDLSIVLFNFNMTTTMFFGMDVKSVACCLLACKPV
jgi:hypothetical protein